MKKLYSFHSFFLPPWQALASHTLDELSIVLYQHNEEDFISITDIARYKDIDHTDTIIQNWMRNRNTIELLGLTYQWNLSSS